MEFSKRIFVAKDLDFLKSLAAVCHVQDRTKKERAACLGRASVLYSRYKGNFKTPTYTYVKNVRKTMKNNDWMKKKERRLATRTKPVDPWIVTAMSGGGNATRNPSCLIAKASRRNDVSAIHNSNGARNNENASRFFARYLPRSKEK